jgi:hypothetical protein
MLISFQGFVVELLVQKYRISKKSRNQEVPLLSKSKIWRSQDCLEIAHWTSCSASLAIWESSSFQQLTIRYAEIPFWIKKLTAHGSSG